MIERLLVVAPHLGVLTAFANTLDELTARRCHVHIAVLEDPPPGYDLTVFAGKFRRLTVGPAPAPDAWTALAVTVRGWLDCWQFCESEPADAQAYQQALADAPGLAARLASNRWLRGRLRRPLTRVLRTIERSTPSSPRITEYLRAFAPDALIVVPLFGIGSIASSYVHAAAEMKVPCIGLPTRWDDTVRGALLHRVPDCVALWNRDQRRQVVDNRGVPSRRTVVLGASLALDGVRPLTPSSDDVNRAEVRRRVILCGAGRLRDPERLAEWRAGLSATLDSAVRDAQILMHLPPAAGVEQSPHASITDAAIVPSAESDPWLYRAELAAALFRADVVVVRETALLFEAAARGRPVVAFLWPNGGDARLARFCAEESAKHEWLSVAHTPAALSAAVSRLLAAPLSAAQQATARSLVRPHGPDLLPGFLLSARVIEEVIDRRAETPASPAASLASRVVQGPLARVVSRHRHAVRWPREDGSPGRVLIAVASAKSLFLHQPLVQALAERSHTLTLVFTARSGFPGELYERVKCDVPGVDVAGTLAPAEGRWSALSRALLGVVCFGLAARHGRSVGVPPKSLSRYGATVLPDRLRRVASVILRAPWLSNALGRVARLIDRVIPASRDASAIIATHKPDVVLILPDDDAVAAFESAATQADLMRAAKSSDMPVAVGIGATELGVHPLTVSSSADVMWVWNTEQHRSAHALGVAADRLRVTGAALLDRHLQPVVNRDTFCALLELPPDRPFVLFAGSSGLLSEPGAEAAFVQAWVKALRTSGDPVLRELVVIVRPSPLGASRWRSMDFGRDPHVVVCPDAFERSGELDAVLLFESVRYSAFTVSADPLTLMTATALGRPALAVSLSRDGKATTPEDASREARSILGRQDHSSSSGQSAQPPQLHLEPTVGPASIAVADIVDRLTFERRRR